MLIDGGGPHEIIFAETCGAGKAVRFGRVAEIILSITDNKDVGIFPASFCVLISGSSIVMRVVALAGNCPFWKSSSL